MRTFTFTVTLCVAALFLCAHAQAQTPAPTATASPCDYYVDFIPTRVPRIDDRRRAYEWLSIRVHFPDGSSKTEKLDYPFVYDSVTQDPFSNLRAPSPVFQLPPPEKRTAEPPLVQYVILHSGPDGRQVNCVQFAANAPALNVKDLHLASIASPHLTPQAADARLSDADAHARWLNGAAVNNALLALGDLELTFSVPRAYFLSSANGEDFDLQEPPAKDTAVSVPKPFSLTIAALRAIESAYADFMTRPLPAHVTDRALENYDVLVYHTDGTALAKLPGRGARRFHTPPGARHEKEIRLHRWSRLQRRVLRRSQDMARNARHVLERSDALHWRAFCLTAGAEDLPRSDRPAARYDVEFRVLR